MSEVIANDELNDPNSESKQNAMNEMEVVPAISKLNVHCLHNIFDYLSLRDVHSVGQTCQSLQQIVGEYFQSNYVDEYKDIESIADAHQANVFSKFHQHILFSTFLQRRRTMQQLISHAANNCHQKFKRLWFSNVNLTGADIQSLQNKWEFIESVKIDHCVANREFCEDFSKLCVNLRRLYVIEFNCRENVLENQGHEWLLQRYPKLEHLHWTQNSNQHVIRELKIFFEKNPHIRSFTTNIEFLWVHERIIQKLPIQLDDFTIEMESEFPPPNIEYVSGNILKNLYENGVFKRLHINLKCFNQESLDKMVPLEALKGLCLNCNSDDSLINLPQWMNLIEFNTCEYIDLQNMDYLATNQFKNLRRATFECILFSDLLEFIRKLVNLTKVKVKCFYDLEYLILNLSALNQEREQLDGAKRMVVYLPEHVYLATKWNSKGDAFSLIDIRRASSDQWSHHFLY